MTTYVIGPTNRDVLLPDPPAEDVRYTVISVDDHVVEPPRRPPPRLTTLTARATRQDRRGRDVTPCGAASLRGGG